MRTGYHIGPHACGLFHTRMGRYTHMELNISILQKYWRLKASKAAHLIHKFAKIIIHLVPKQIKAKMFFTFVVKLKFIFEIKINVTLKFTTYMLSQ